MESDLKELFKGMIYLKYQETKNLTMAFNSVETYVQGLLIETELEEMENCKEEEDEECL